MSHHDAQNIVSAINWATYGFCAWMFALIVTLWAKP